MFSGRIGRLAFLGSIALGWVILSAAALVSQIIVGSYMSWPDFPAAGSGWLAWADWFLLLFAVLAILLVYTTAMIRRLHDLGHAGWLAPLLFVPIANLVLMLVLLIKAGDPDENRFGPGRVDSSFKPIRLGSSQSRHPSRSRGA